MSTTRPPDPGPLTRRNVSALLQDTTPWLSCDQCFERMDSFAEAVVRDPTHQDEEMAAHLRGCAACDEEARSLVQLLENS